jgi:hypothetical protein
MLNIFKGVPSGFSPAQVPWGMNGSLILDINEIGVDKIPCYVSCENVPGYGPCVFVFSSDDGLTVGHIEANKGGLSASVIRLPSGTRTIHHDVTITDESGMPITFDNISGKFCVETREVDFDDRSELKIGDVIELDMENASAEVVLVSYHEYCPSVVLKVVSTDPELNGQISIIRCPIWYKTEKYYVINDMDIRSYGPVQFKTDIYFSYADDEQ